VREKVLVKFCKMLRIANDERTPEGERTAATARLDVLLARWSFTDVEIGRQIQREADAEEGDVAKALRAQRQVQEMMRRQAMAAMSGWRAEIHTGETMVSGSRNTIIFTTKGFA
jgi:hypothetical protein